MGKHEYTTLDRARDELYSHIVRCEVLDVDKDEHVDEWLDETMEFMAERYPELSDLQLAQLRMMADRYLSPVIDHGRGNTASSPDADEGDSEATAEVKAEATDETDAEADAEEAPAPAAVAEGTESSETSEKSTGVAAA